jgi:hypothetical protein
MAFTKRFTIDGSDHVYSAVSYGPSWNGWVTPIVTRKTLEDIARQEDPTADHFELSFVYQTGVAQYRPVEDDLDEIVRIAPIDDVVPLYNLAGLGRTFYEIEG